MINHVMEMLKVVDNPIEYLDTLKIPYSVRNVQLLDPLVPGKHCIILIEYENTRYIARYRIIDGEWFYVY